MQITYIQHVPFETPGALANWASERKYDQKIIHLYEGESLPDPENIDLIVVLGGPMSISDEVTFKFLNKEKKWLRNSLEKGNRVLGICLGAQLLADALNAKVYPSGTHEIGFQPVQVHSDTITKLWGWPGSFLPLHWHGDTFDLPANSVLMASSQAVENQAFRYKKQAIGLQFHLEATQENVEIMLKHCAEELELPGNVDSEHAIREQAEKNIPFNQMLLFQMMDHWLEA